MLNPIIDELFRAARRAGRRESREAYAFDALVDLARRRGRAGETPDSVGAADTSAAEGSGSQPARSSSPTHLALIRIDLEALVRGRVEGDELCEVAGVGPIPVTTARDLLGDSIVKLVITNGIDVANVTHLGRGPTAAQRVALLWSSAGCVVQGCSRTIGIETDHGVPWADDQVTELANLDRALRSPPRPQDPARLGAGGRHRQETDGSARWPASSREAIARLDAHRPEAAAGPHRVRIDPVRRRCLTHES